MARGSSKSIRKLGREKLRKGGVHESVDVLSEYIASESDQGEDSIDDDEDLSYWWTCECLVSLALVVALGFLPFSLHSNSA